MLLWLIVVNVDNPINTRTYLGIKVKVTNAEVITNAGRSYRVIDNTDIVSVKVKAKRSVLNVLNAENIMVEANMKELSLGTQVPLSVSISGFEGLYSEATTTPQNMQVQIEENASKKFPIISKTRGDVRGGFAVGTTSVNPETVTLQGPESVINRIDKVVAEVNVSGVAKDVVIPSELVIYDADENVIDATVLTNNLGEDGVTVSVKINEVKKIPLRFETSGITVAEGHVLGHVEAEPSEVQVAGTKRKVEELKEIFIPKEVLSVKNLSEKTEVVVDITPYLPEGIQLVDENAGSVAVTIHVEQGGTKTITIPSGSIKVINIPPGMKWSHEDTEEVTLRIAGSDDVLNELTLDAESVYINLVNFQTVGVHQVPVEVNLPPGASLVGEVVILVNLVKE